MAEGTLTVTTAASSRDLIGLDTLKEELGVTDSSTDALLARWIAEASDEVEVWCARSFARETVREVFREAHLALTRPYRAGMEGKPLMLSRFPVATVTAVSEDDVAIGTDDFDLDPEAGLLWRMQSAHRTTWSASKIQVDYVGGYALPDGAPVPLQRAVQTMLRERWFARGRDPSVMREEVAGIGMNIYFPPSSGGQGASPVESMLAPFRQGFR